MTDLMRRIRRAVFKSADASETELRDALNELGISGGSDEPNVLRRIQRAILTDGHDEDENLRSALDDLQIGGGINEPRPMDRIRRAILRPPRNAEVLLRNALDDLGVTEAPSGGGGEPQWLEDFRAPSGNLPTTAVDFANAHYWAEGAEVAVATLFASADPPGSVFNAADISAGQGYTGESGYPSFAGALLTDALTAGGRTFVFEFDPSDTSGSCGVQLIDLPGFEYEVTGRGDLSSESPTEGFIRYIDPVVGTESNAQPQGVFAAGVNRLGVTLTPTAAALSINGTAIMTLAPTGEGHWTAANHAYITASSVLIKSLAVYAPQPNGDLPTLSA